MSKKGENIYKRKDGRWEARYEKSRSATGKIVYGYCCGKTYKEAKQKMQDAISHASLQPKAKKWGSVRMLLRRLAQRESNNDKAVKLH